MTMHFAPMELDPRVAKALRPVQYGPGAALDGRVYEIPSWKTWPIRKQLAFIRLFTETTARDPHIAQLAARIIREAGVKDRDYPRQWAALLKWVQTNLQYVNEPNERLQSPQYTLTAGMGDCDDLAICLGALGHSLRLPFRLTISGRSLRGGERVRYVEQNKPPPRGVKWAHIYLCVGWPPFRPDKWQFAEPTMNVPFGWDATSAARSGMPELAGADLGGSLFGATVEDEAAKETRREAIATLPAPVRFLMGMDWKGILAAALPSVISAWAIQRFLAKAGPRTNPRGRKSGVVAVAAVAAASILAARRVLAMRRARLALAPAA